MQFLLFSTILCYRLLDFHVKTGTRFSLRDKRLFEISEVEITRVDCNYKYSDFDCIYKYSDFFAANMWVAFSAKDINIFAIFQERNFNVTLANKFVKFWTTGPCSRKIKRKINTSDLPCYIRKQDNPTWLAIYVSGSNFHVSRDPSCNIITINAPLKIIADDILKCFLFHSYYFSDRKMIHMKC